jgi:hypothetical protein
MSLSMVYGRGRPQEVKSMGKCDRCKNSYSPLDRMRFWSGHWTERVGGEYKEYDTLCNDCHRQLVREN